MGKFENFLICCDYDNTLTYNGIFSENNAEAVRSFRSEGGKFAVITGRDYRATEEFRHLLAADEYLATNFGTVLHKAGKVQEAVFINVPVRALISELSAENNVASIGVFYSESAVFFESISEFDSNLPSTENVTKISVAYSVKGYSDTAIEIVKNKFGKYCATSRISSSIVEIFNKNASKGVAALKLKELLKREILVCAGDSDSDIPMLDAADIKVAPSTAAESVKNIADYVIENSKDGILTRLLEILDNRE